MLNSIEKLTIAFFKSKVPTFTQFNKSYLLLFVLIGIITPSLNNVSCVNINKIYIISFLVFGAFFVLYRARENYLDSTLVLGSLAIFITTYVSVIYQFNFVLFVSLLSFIVIFPLIISIINSGVHNAIRFVHSVYAFLVILLLVEYILLTFNFGPSLQDFFFCSSVEIRDYRSLHNRFSELVGLETPGLNSLFLGPQFANIISVQTFFLSCALFVKQKTHGVRYFIIAAISLALLILSPTGTGLIVFSVTTIVYLILFSNHISQKVILLLLFVFFLFVASAYFYIMTIHGTAAIEIVVVKNILDYSKFPLNGVLLGLGGEAATYFSSTEMEIVNMVGRNGIIASGIFLYIFISTIFNRVLLFSNMDGRINAVIFTPLLVSLIHYSTFLSSGAYSLTMMHLAIAVVLKKQMRDRYLA